ncbi:MAG: A24 family peptidase [Candidatus Marinimicrobia bacterium]|nr:A24 family peptidase [Candidatus Neomarinimicrobiota bacterium]MCF7922048.1 A24 family peptidase [Candidatus Neomarinimicrobiota bacterium]
MIPAPEIIFMGVLVGIILASSLTHLFAISSLGISVFSKSPVCESCADPQPYSRRIPILATLFFSKKCPVCGHEPPRLYAFLEMVIFAFSIWAFSAAKPVLALQISVLGFALLGVTYMDLKKWIIPNVFILYILAVALLAMVVGTVSIAHALSGLLVASVVSLFIILPQKFGSGDKTLALGDVKLCLAVALWLGWILSAYVFFLASVLAILTWMLSGFFKGFSARRRVPFGPFVALSTMIFGIGRVLDPQFVTHLLTYRF